VGLGIPLAGLAFVTQLTTTTPPTVPPDEPVITAVEAPRYDADDAVARYDADEPPIELVYTETPLVLVDAINPPPYQKLNLTIRRGDTLDKLFRQHDLDLGNLAEISRLDEARHRFRKLKPGDQFEITHDQGDLVSMYSKLDLTSALKIERGENGFKAEIVERPVEKRKRLAHGTIETSLFESAVDAGLSDRVVMEAYEQSVHGMAARKSGLLGAAVCPDCHGNHRILPGDQPRSATHRQNIPTLCGKCHPGILETYDRSIHGKGMRGGIAESPVCTDCHGEHTITKITDPSSSVYAKNIPKTCSSCHENEAISTRYALPKKRFSTYMDSFHGIRLEYGMTTAANCSSCHGFHDVLPASDPASSVNPANLPRTCGKCHPGANPNFAVGKMHVDASNKESGIVYYTALFFKYLTIGTMLALILHIFLDMYGRTRRLRGGK